MEVFEGCPHNAAKNCCKSLRLQHVKQPRKVSLLQCLQHCWSLTIAERILGHCIADAWASSSCERTVPSQVCACSIDFYDINIPLLYLDGETTMWITTHQNQTATSSINDTQHAIWIHHTTATNNCIPTVYEPRTDVTGLSDMWGTKKRKR